MFSWIFGEKKTKEKRSLGQDVLSTIFISWARVDSGLLLGVLKSGVVIHHGIIVNITSTPSSGCGTTSARVILTSRNLVSEAWSRWPNSLLIWTATSSAMQQNPVAGYSTAPWIAWILIHGCSPSRIKFLHYGPIYCRNLNYRSS